MTFSRKHYRAIAKIIKNAGNKDQIVLDLAEMFKEDNWKFDFQKFAKASGILAER